MLNICAQKNINSSIFSNAQPLWIKIGLLLLVAACGQVPHIDPISTTYPADRRTVEKSIVNLPIPISISVNANLSGAGTSETTQYSPGTPAIQFPVSQEIIGDVAEEDLWIVPRSRGEFSEKRLMARVSEGGRRTCGSDFRVKNTKYYYGPEATLRMSNIGTPALSVTYRCPAKRLGISDPDAAEVARLARRFKDHRYFDILVFESPAKPKYVEAVIRQQFGEKLIYANTKGSSSKFIASKSSGRWVTLGPQMKRAEGIPEHVIVVVRPTKNGTKLALMRMFYTPTMHLRGVGPAGTERPGYLKKAQPARRDFADLQTRRLASTILGASEQ